MRRKIAGKEIKIGQVSAVSKQLSIVIPTYNRRERLAETLRAILPNCAKFNVGVLILDNASPEPVEELINSDFSSFRPLVKVVRNRFNIGANANICRCFELCETEWMWLLGDDDLPKSEAIELIINKISGLDPGCCMVNFRGGIYRGPGLGKIENFEQLAGAVKDGIWFSDFLFISSGVFQVKCLREYLSSAYHFSYTCSAQILLPIMALQQGCHILDEDSLIAQWQPPAAGQGWSQLHYLLGVCALSDLKQLRSLHRRVVGNAVEFTGKGALGLAKKILSNAFAEPREHMDFWAGVALRFAAVLPFWKKPLLVLICFFLTLCKHFAALFYVARPLFFRSQVRNEAERL